MSDQQPRRPAPTVSVRIGAVTVRVPLDTALALALPGLHTVPASGRLGRVLAALAETGGGTRR